MLYGMWRKGSLTRGKVTVGLRRSPRCAPTSASSCGWRRAAMESECSSSRPSTCAKVTSRAAEVTSRMAVHGLGQRPVSVEPVSLGADAAIHETQQRFTSGDLMETSMSEQRRAWSLVSGEERA
eukprot:992865-Rhodomonas_salina.4